MPDSKPPPASTASKRIKKEIADLAKENLGDISLTPDEANIFVWKAILPGPAGSPYEGGRFEVDIRIPSDYPFSPPKLHFITKVYHCNISHTGAICLDLLKSAWSPALSLYKVILSLSSLLTDPNPADPLVPAIAQEYRTQRKKHDTTAQEWVKLYAMPKVTAPPAVVPPKKAKKPDRLGPVPRFDASGNPVCPPAPFVRGRRLYPVDVSPPRSAAGPSATINLADDSDDEVDQSIEILGENPMSSNRAGGSSTGARPARDREPPRKKARGTREDSDEVIVVED